jgi:hypothetical protein
MGNNKPNKLNEGDEKTPRMRSESDESFEEDPKAGKRRINEAIVFFLVQIPGDLLLNLFRVGLEEEVEQGAAEVVGVGVGVAQLVGDGVEEQVFAWGKAV